MHSRSLAALAVSVVAVVGAAAPAHAVANLVQNGSFELDTVPAATFTAGHGRATLVSGNTQLTNWSITGAVNLVQNYNAALSNSWQSQAGNLSLQLTAAGGISQTINTTIGLKYFVNFQMAGAPTIGLRTDLRGLTVTENGLNSQLYVFNAHGDTAPHMGWIPELYVFTATSLHTVITFLGSQQGSGTNPTRTGLAALDNIFVSTPEPATWVMMLLGVGAIGGMVRRERRGATLSV